MFKLYHNERHIDDLLEEVKGKQKELDRLVSKVDTLASTQESRHWLVCKNEERVTM